MTAPLRACRKCGEIHRTDVGCLTAQRRAVFGVVLGAIVWLAVACILGAFYQWWL